MGREQNDSEPHPRSFNLTGRACTLMRELYSACEISREQFDLLLHLRPIGHRLVDGLKPQEGVEVEQLRSVVQARLPGANVA